MKQLSIILFAIFYLFAVSGVTVHYHYCGGKLTAVDLFTPRKNPCPCGEQSEMPGCCTHKVLKSKTGESFKPTIAELGVFNFHKIVAAVVPSATTSFVSSVSKEAPFKYLLSHRRSRPNVPLYILHLALRN